MINLSSELRQSSAEVISLTCVAIILTVFISLLIFIVLQGVRYFAPSNVYLVTLTYPNSQFEQFFRQERQQPDSLKALMDERFDLQYSSNIQSRPGVAVETAEDVLEITTSSGLTVHGTFVNLTSDISNQVPLTELNNLLLTVRLLDTQRKDVLTNQLEPLHRQIAMLERQGVDLDSPAMTELHDQFLRWQTHVKDLDRRLDNYSLVLFDANQKPQRIGLVELNELFYPNRLSVADYALITIQRIWQFLTDYPKQAATSGGVFPAIFGTVLMVLIMSIVVAPFGMIAAIYLHEYAPDNKFTALIRIGVSNMAAVPSVVYGVFGLGFFVYTLGGSIDQLLYSSNLPSPTFGTPGLLWASLTMGLLTLPVVIVATEEGLSRVPQGLRQGSYALGATKFETIVKVVMPMASPGMLTGIILAVARAAGEVAPLILVGAVKFAPSLPIDGSFPFLHLERQFMHLGVFIYDGAFHSQIDSKASSMMFASCMLLIFIVFILNLSAVIIRKRLRERFDRS